MESRRCFYPFSRPGVTCPSTRPCVRAGTPEDGPALRAALTARAASLAAAIVTAAAAADPSACSALAVADTDAAADTPAQPNWAAGAAAGDEEGVPAKGRLPDDPFGVLPQRADEMDAGGLGAFASVPLATRPGAPLRTRPHYPGSFIFERRRVA